MLSHYIQRFQQVGYKGIVHQVSTSKVNIIVSLEWPMVMCCFGNAKFVRNKITDGIGLFCKMILIFTLVGSTNVEKALVHNECILADDASRNESFV